MWTQINGNVFSMWTRPISGRQLKKKNDIIRTLHSGEMVKSIKINDGEEKGERKGGRGGILLGFKLEVLM